MFKVSDSAIIEHQPAQVFAVVADPHKQLEWDSGTLKRVEKLTPGPLGRGARYRGQFKGFGDVEYEIPEFEPGQRFVHHTVMRIGDMRHIFEFEAVPGGTRLTQSMLVEPKGMGKLMAPLMRVKFRKRLREIAAELGHYLQEERLHMTRSE